MKPKCYLIFLLGIAFSGMFSLEMSAQNRIVIVNECDGYPEDVNVFLKKMERRTGGVTDSHGWLYSTRYYYPKFEELAYWRANENHSRTNIQNLQTSCLVAETVGGALSSEGDTIRVLNPGELTILKGYWNLTDKEMNADTLRNRLRNLLCDRHKCNTLLLLTSCLSDFNLRSWKEPGKKPRDVSGEADLTVRAGWAVYDRETGKIVEEFQTEGKAMEAWNLITREQINEINDKRYSLDNIQDASERALMKQEELPSWVHGPLGLFSSLKDRSVFHYGEPAIYPLIRMAAGQIAERLQEDRINEN